MLYSLYSDRTDTESFMNDLQSAKLNPYPGPQSVVVMDNCAIHHDKDIDAIVVNECGMFETPFKVTLILVWLACRCLLDLPSVILT